MTTPTSAPTDVTPPNRAGSPLRVARALWRYRGQIASHGDAFQAEVATAVRTTLDMTMPGRVAMRGYRFAMRLLVVGIVAFVLLGLLVASLLWQVEPIAALGGFIPLALAGLLSWWRLSWGAPLDWVDEFADPTRAVSVTELPARLHQLALETRTLANVPARVADELDALAAQAGRR